MATQFRDTAFGRLVRLASKNHLLQYPDEIDPTIWKKALPARDASSSEASDGTIREGFGPAHIVEGGKDTYLVDWYGPDDPEVIISRISLVTLGWNQIAHHGIRIL